VPGVLGLTDLAPVDGAGWPALTAQLLGEARPRLAVARLSGGAIALGRYQRAETVLTAQGRAAIVRRRVTGGRAIALGEGLIAVALVLPHRSWLVDADPEALPASRFLNRAVRGVLSGLGRLGVGAFYFGRDFVTVDSLQAGALSFDVTSSGAALLECILAAEAHWWLPAACDALPARAPQRGVPGPGAVAALEGKSSAAVLEALGQGFAERFGLTCAVDGRPLSGLPAIPEPASLEKRSSLREISGGFAEVGVTLAHGRISAASFNGDFLADSAGVEAAEQAVIGAEPTLEAIAPRLNGVYSRQRHTVLGVPDLTVWADALIEACRT
jgi:hypothetical protein